MTERAYDRAKRGIAGICCLAFLLLTGVTVTKAQETLPSCLSARGEAAVVACQRELRLEPYNLDIRFALSDALIGLRRHEEAVEVLKEALARAPGSERIKKKLSLAESYLEEQLWIEKRRAQQETSSSPAAPQKLDTQTKLNIIRCTKLKGDTALRACNTVLKALPDDPKLYRSKADALMTMDRVAEAIMAYQESLRLAPADDETSKKLSAAQARRGAIATECQRLTGSAALRACDAALLEGAKDEYAIQRHRGDLLLGMKRTAEAEEAYRSALDLRPDDLEIKKKLDSLTKPATVAKVDKIAKPQRESRPQETAIAQPPIAAPTSTPSEEQTRETLTPLGAAELGQPGEGDAEPIQPSTSLPPRQTSKRYSNRPLVSGITH